MGDDDVTTNYVKPVMLLKNLSEAVEKNIMVSKVKAY